jgi:hypothetical protein
MDDREMEKMVFNGGPQNVGLMLLLISGSHGVTPVTY